MLRITDKAFKYTSSHDTDLKKKFAKIMADQRRAKAEALAATSRVLDIKPRIKGKA
jgi:hypothetical protein